MSSTFLASDAQQDQTLIGALRQWLPGESWGRLRKLIRSRRVLLNETLCLDEARRLRPGETVVVADQARPDPAQACEIDVRYLDRHVVVIEKPAGIATVRHALERNWPARRKRLQPTLDEIVVDRLARGRSPRGPKRPSPRLRIVHRLDRETSGLLVFARSAEAEESLIEQFRKHTVTRSYVAVVHGHVKPGTIDTFIARDRGDGLRGSVPARHIGKRAVTHVEVIERLGRYTLVQCRLETGRTHQIRIHLAENGHRVCGERVYHHAVGQKPMADTSGARRQALHAAELHFRHPVTGELLALSSALPRDLMQLIEQLKKKGRLH